MKVKGLRWWVVALIAIAAIINYIDRTSLSVLWPEIAKDLYPGHTADETKAIYALISIIFVFPMLSDKQYLGKYLIG
ncbi:hypothetical protein [Polaribacter atrinae]|uniref:hypothetical protein n=1 Tax=Polaribacter atrinae TaxID=1333662 RepID=UPI0030F5FAFB